MISEEREWPAEGHYIDFRDKDNNSWQVGLVLAKIKNHIKVRSEGWASKYDQLIPLNSNKIRPFRSVIKGYTGQTKNPSPRDHWKYSSEKHQERLDKLKSFLGEINSKSQEEIIQYLRGEHYFYMDFLMTQTYSSLQALNNTYVYFREHLAFVKEYLENIAKVGIERWCQEEPLDQNESAGSVAVRQSYYEVFDAVYILSGLYPRQTTFQKVNEKVFKQLGRTHDVQISKLLLESKIDEVYTSTLQLLYDKSVTDKKPIPVSLIYSFFHLFVPVQKSIMSKTDPPFNTQPANKQQRKKIVTNLLDIIKQQLQFLAPADLKNFQTQKQIENLLAEMKPCYFKYGLEKLVFEYIEKMRLKVAVLLIQCDTLERKLKGIAKIKEICESLIVVNEFAGFKLSRQAFSQFLFEESVIYHLYIENEHPEIVKRGSEMCQLFFKQRLIGLEQMLFIWQQCSHKHEALRKIILSMWVDIIQYVEAEYLERFVQPIIDSCKQNGEGGKGSLFVQEWEVQLLFSFIYNVLKFYGQMQTHAKPMAKLTPELLNIGYNKLISVAKSNNFNHLLEEYTKVINVSAEACNAIISESYNQISNNQNLAANIALLTQFYIESISKYTCVPKNAVQVIFSTLQRPQNKHLSLAIFRLLDQVIAFSNHIENSQILSKQSFDQLWKNAQQNQQNKQQFYNWLLKKNNEGLFGVPLFEINQNIPHVLKSEIFLSFLCDHNKLDYFSLSLHEFELFKQFLLQHNEAEGRVELKKMMNLIKIIRVKEADIIGNKQTWDIFLNCKQEEVIKQVSKLILSLHFHFQEAVEFKSRKAKAVLLMNRLEKHIKDGFKKGNFKLMKHSLILLKDVIDFVKERPVKDSFLHNYQQYFKTSIKIEYQKSRLQLEIFFGVTYYQIKTKIANLIKLDRTQFQLIGSKNQEIPLEYGQVPFCFMQHKNIKVYRLTDQDDTIPKLVLNFIKDRIENTLIDMLEDESICENVYNVLEDIEIKAEQAQVLLQKLASIISRQQQQKTQQISNNFQIYFHLFYQRILQFLIDKPNFLKKFILSGSLADLTNKINVPITHPLIVPYIAHSTESIFKILKKYKNKDEFDEETSRVLSELFQPLKQSCMAMMQQICSYINQNIEQKEAADPKRIKILFNCLNIIESIENPLKLINYLLTHSRFLPILEKVYLGNNYSEIRFILAQKLKKFIKFSKEKQNLTADLQSKFADIFIKYLYAKARELQGNYSPNKKTLHLYKFIAFLIKTFTQQHFHAYVLNQQQPKDNFYATLISNLQNLADPVEPTANVNYILSGHLNILAAIYNTEPALLSEGKNIDFLLYDCLFYREGKTTRQDVRCKKTESIKEALQALKAVSLHEKPTQFLNVISQLDRFHKIPYWRTSEHWSTNIQNEVKAKYVGLENPGCICYLNSLLQQLFMTKDFRNNVYDLKLEKNSASKEDNSLETLKGLKQLFLQLQHSEQIALNPVFFTKTIKGSDNKSMIKLGYQMDIDQFCSILFDKIEQQLSRIPTQINFIKHSYGGVYAHQIISKECVHSSEREEQFLSIGLEVKKHILQSFSALIKGETLDGENKYFCQKCDKKVKAEKMLTIKTFPQHLILSLKRFEFNYEIDAKIKINDFCEFPVELDLKKFSQQEINKNSASKQVIVEEFEQFETVTEQFPDEYFKYKLKGVVVHTGSTDSGHYYSFIEDQEGNWFEFNDNSVTPFDFKNLPEEAFGCKDSFEEKTRNAYLIFYEKVPQQKQAEQVVKTEESETDLQNANIISSIVHKNKVINKFRLIFSADYSEFIESLIVNAAAYEFHELQKDQWNTFLLCYYLLVKIRQSQLEQVISFSHIIEKAIKNDEKMTKLYLSALSSIRFIEEVFVYCPVRQKCKIIGQLLKTAFLIYYDSLVDEALQKNSVLFPLMENISVTSLMQGNIYELQLCLRQLLSILKNRKDDHLISFMTCNLQFNNVILSHLLGMTVPKHEKQMMFQIIDQHIKTQISITGNVRNQGRKYLPLNTKQSWHLLEYIIQFLVQYTKQNAESFIHQQKLSQIQANLDKIDESGALTRIIHQCGTHKSVYHMYRAFKLMNMVDRLILASQKGLKDFESSKYRPFMLLLRCILLDKDTNEQIIIRVIETLQAVHKANQKYFLEVNFLHQWILKYARQSPTFLQILSLQSEFLVEIVNWMITRPLPSADILKKHKNPNNDRLLNRMHGILVSTQAKQYQNKTQVMRLQFEGIIKKQPIKAQKVDLQQQLKDEFEVGQFIRSFEISSNKWSKGKVVSNDFSLLKVAMQEQQGKQLHFWTDCERIEPFREQAEVQEEEEVSKIKEEQEDKEAQQDGEQDYMEELYD